MFFRVCCCNCRPKILRIRGVISVRRHDQIEVFGGRVVGAGERRERPLLQLHKSSKFGAQILHNFCTTPVLPLHVQLLTPWRLR
ncbi:hypothetical protein EV356DRAFT_66202 [Viridothelium virens]|uniref:Uncharacterized protein n=1 Tax=Viridothelium virens TaxID=1048519 RepID=A0A6A6GS07_VIRVR|nr:hypothetical protein EV356DRAFT_66202 [Viridothelium virens]